MVLRPVTRRFLEEHHIFGIANDRPTTAALCFNCHALATEGLLQAGVSMTKESDPNKFSANMFRALQVHFQNMSEASGRFASHAEQAETNNLGPMVVHRGPTDLVGFILHRAWPIWKVHRGKVPRTALRNLEIDGDWPRGTARAAMKRISEDEDVRYLLQTWRY
jgi:hypothetical protein